MKKIALGVIFLLLVCLLAGCGNDIDEGIIRKIDTKDPQVRTALGYNQDSKEQLLQSPDLHAESLIALCANMGDLYLQRDDIQNMYIDAFDRVDLTADQQVLIASMGNYVYNKGLLLSSKLTSEGLVAVCENSQCFNLESESIKKLFKNAIERTELTTKQLERISKTEICSIVLDDMAQ